MDRMPGQRARVTSYGVLLAISVSHLLNDTLQSIIPAIYPVVKDGFHLTFTQVGLITLTFQLTASLLQPVVGAFTDRRPPPFSLPHVLPDREVRALNQIGPASSVRLPVRRGSGDADRWSGR